MTFHCPVIPDFTYIFRANKGTYKPVMKFLNINIYLRYTSFPI